MLGRVFNIQRFCVHDGPGVRTVLFFKGCPLHCKWCCNPESQHREKELMYDMAKCIGCGSCATACQAAALETIAGKLRINRQRCTMCGLCTDTCHTGALNISGRDITAAEAAELLLQDRNYYFTSGGGITFSGGEASAQADFIAVLAGLLKAEGMHLALETCGVCPEEKFRKLAELMDVILFDIKLMDGEKFSEYTGGDLGLVLRNLKTAAICPELKIRVPLIPGVNMEDSFYCALGELADNASVSEIELLPYHRLGENKYAQLGLQAWHSHTASPEENRRALQEISKHCSKKVRLAGT